MPLNSVFVLGMHRSGTSALAGALPRLGIIFASPDDELQRALDNPNGFFERTSILDFSNTLLSSHQWAWDKVDLHPLNTEKISPHINEARCIVEGLSNDGPVGIKDPRSCLLMPFWRRALLDRFEAVVITRDPAEVAWSLHVRDGLPVSTGLALYIAYSAHLASGIQGLSSHVVRYEDLVDSPSTELTLIAQFLHDRGLPISHEPSDIEVAAKSIDPSLRRATFPVWLEAHPLTIEARDIREQFHQSPGSDISLTPSQLCRDVLDFQTAAHDLCDANHQLQLVQANLDDLKVKYHDELAQVSNDYVKAVVILEERIDELSVTTTELESELATQTQVLASQAQALEHTRQQLEITAHSTSLKLGLFLTWPIRHLRISKRTS
jgi:hypothetical protein